MPATSQLDRLRPLFERGARRGTGGLEYAPTPLGEEIPWDLQGRAALLARRASRVLDLAAGDGGLLAAALAESEASAVGVDRRRRHLDEARRRLGPRVALARGVPEAVPFRRGSFDLVLLRLRRYQPEELVDLVRPGGAILMEQVHGRNWHELRRFFPRMPPPGDLFEHAKRVFRRAGFELIDARTHERPVAFAGLEPLVYTLGAAPWIVPHLSLEKDLDALLELEAELTDERGIALTRSRYILEVRKPPPLE